MFAGAEVALHLLQPPEQVEARLPAFKRAVGLLGDVEAAEELARQDLVVRRFGDVVAPRSLGPPAPHLALLGFDRG